MRAASPATIRGWPSLPKQCFEDFRPFTHLSMLRYFRIFFDFYSTPYAHFLPGRIRLANARNAGKLGT